MKALDPLSRALLSASEDCHQPTLDDSLRIRRKLIVRLGGAAGLGTLGSMVTQSSAATAATASGSVVGSTAAGAVLGSSKLMTITKLLGLTILASTASVGGYHWVASRGHPETGAQVSTVAASRSASVATKAAPASGTSAVPLVTQADHQQPPAVIPGGFAVDHAGPASPANRPQQAVETEGPTKAASNLPAVATFPSSPPSLADEARGLAQAQAALREGRAAQALALLDRQNVQFLDGSLGEERAAARVFALCKIGDVRAANVAATEFLRRTPHSVLAERVANACPNRK